MDLKELCAKLKQKRKELGYSLEEVVEKTKLYPSVIKDIEEGNLEKIDQAYLKGFLRIYAEFLKIPVEELKTSYSIEVKSLKREQSFLKNIKKIKIPPKVRKIIFFLIVFLVSLFLATKILSFLGQEIKKRFQRKAKQPIQTSVQIQQKKEEVETMLKQKIEEPITVAITAKKNCFVVVKVDGKVFFEGLLKKDVPEIWTAKKEIELKISDGSCVYIEVNGKPLPPLSSTPKQIRSLKISSAGISIIK